MTWYSLSTTPTRETAVSIHGEIGVFGHPASELIDALGEVQRVEIFIDSPGGSLPEALAVYDRLARIDTTVTIGRAYSAAAVLAQCGRHRQILADGTFMVHTPVDYVFGPAPTLRERADALEGLCRRMRDILVTRSGLPVETVRGWLADGDHYMDAKECLALGLADSILPAAPPAPRPGPMGDGRPGFTEDESLLLELLRALGNVRTHDRQRLARDLSSWFTYSVKGMEA